MTPAFALLPADWLKSERYADVITHDLPNPAYNAVLCYRAHKLHKVIAVTNSIKACVELSYVISGRQLIWAEPEFLAWLETEFPGGVCVVKPKEIERFFQD